MSKKQYKKKPKSKPSSAVGESKPTTPKTATPDPQTPKPPQPWSSWEWSIEGKFYYRARKGDNDEWEYETSLPITFPSTIPCKETPRTLPSYCERPSSEYPRVVVETVHVVPVSDSKPGGEKGEYTWGEAHGCDDMKVGDAEGKKEEVEKKEVKEEPKDSKKDKSKGLKKSDVDEWRNSVSDVAHSVEELIIVEEEIQAAEKPREKKKKDKDKHHEKKEYERKEWRRRPETRK